VTAFGQSAAQENSAAEKRHETITDETVQNYAKHEPHMAAALQHLRQAEEELEKTSNNHGPYRDQAANLTKQDESKIMYGMCSTTTSMWRRLTGHQRNKV
jgi:hypothetical protein